LVILAILAIELNALADAPPKASEIARQFDEMWKEKKFKEMVAYFSELESKYPRYIPAIVANYGLSYCDGHMFEAGEKMQRVGVLCRLTRGEMDRFMIGTSWLFTCDFSLIEYKIKIEKAITLHRATDEEWEKIWHIEWPSGLHPIPGAGVIAYAPEEMLGPMSSQQLNLLIGEINPDLLKREKIDYEDIVRIFEESGRKAELGKLIVKAKYDLFQEDSLIANDGIRLFADLGSVELLKFAVERAWWSRKRYSLKQIESLPERERIRMCSELLSSDHFYYLWAESPRKMPGNRLREEERHEALFRLEFQGFLNECFEARGQKAPKLEELQSPESRKAYAAGLTATGK